MSRFRPLTLLAIVLLAVPAFARVGDPRPVGQLRLAPTGGYSLAPELTWNGSWLVSWSGGEGAARLDDEGTPRDVPAIFLRESGYSLGAGTLPLGDGWLVGSVWWAGWWPGVESWLALDQISAAGEVTARTEHSMQLPLNPRAARIARYEGTIVLAVSWGRGFNGADNYTTHVFLLGAEQPSFEVEGGPLVDFVATAEGFTLVLADRVVRLDGELRVLGVALAHSESPILALVSGSDGRVVISSSGFVIDVHEVTEAGLTVVATLATPFRTWLLRGALSGETLLVAWKSATAGNFGGSTLDMFAARISPDGSIDGPVIIEKATDRTNRYVSSGATSFDLEGDPRGWMIARSAGSWPPTHAFLDIVTRRLERDAPLALLEGEPVVASWRATDQTLIGEVTTGDTTLVAWSERTLSTLAPARHYAARYDNSGELLDQGEVPISFAVWSVAVVNEGFLLFGNDVHLLAHGSRELEKLPVARSGYEQIVCAEETCLRAWVDSGEVRVAKQVGDTQFDPQEGIVVASSVFQIVSMATDGTDFFLAWKSEQLYGAILRSAIVRTSGELRAEVSDFVAAPSPAVLSSPAVLWTGTEYAAVWRHDQELRTMRFTRDGASIDGDETGWEGRRTGVTGFVAGILQSEDGPVVLAQEGLRVREFTVAPDGMLAPHGPPAPESSCETAGRCLRITSLEVTGDPWYRAWRLFLQTETRSDRRRPAAR